jgi:two-component system, chemotaxis family, sensor kinase CheA
MSIDLSQFHQVFFEESFEGLDEMESSLMELDPLSPDAETINSIFRAAHSIKGGSATFGFSVVAEFTHILETLLDEIRAETRGISQDDVDLFLQSVDCLRNLLGALQSNEEPDTGLAAQLKRSFEAILAKEPNAPSAVGGDAVAVDITSSEEVKAEASENESPQTDGPWKILFKPHRDMLRTGNEPLRMFRELAENGTLDVEPLLNDLPSFSAINPEECYLGWQLNLRERVARSAVEEVFEWVDDEADIDILLACHKTKSEGWSIFFQPNTDILRTGNEPLRLFRELADLGDLDIEVDTEQLPSWPELNPENCHLCWHLTVSGDVTQEQVSEVFEWVADESLIRIEPLRLSEAEDLSESAVSELPQETALDAGGEVKAAPVVTVATAAAPTKSKPTKTVTKDAGSIRVGIDKIDNLINMVGELVITQSMLGQLGTDFEADRLPKLMEGLGQLEQNTRELQESVMRIRMLPISFAFSRFPRMVRDLSRRLDKEINLELLGEQTELDKTVMEKIGDPLVHLVRNAVDHGIEIPEERRQAGKSDVGNIVLNAYHQGGNVVIEIDDDGRGLNRDKILEKAIEKNIVTDKEAKQFSDEQVYDLIFAPGFSTAAEVSDVSGRGVGMDVVKRNILELNGTVEITSKAGYGSRITIRLPLTLAILDGQLVRVGTHTYIFPLVSIVESLQTRPELVNRVAGGCDVFQLRNEYVPIIRLFEIFDIVPENDSLEDSLLVVVECDGEKVGVVVDELSAQQQVVIKSLEQNYQRVEGVSGATILGDGTVALILDIVGLVSLAGINHQLLNTMVPLANELESQGEMARAG